MPGWRVLLIPGTLGVELLVVLPLLDWRLMAAAGVTVLMNLLSLILGTLLQIPIVTFGDHLSGNISLVYIVVISLAANALIEGAVVRAFAKNKSAAEVYVKIGLVNVLTAGVAMGVAFGGAVFPFRLLGG